MKIAAAFTATGLALGLLAAPSIARAEDVKAACVAAYDRSQSLRQSAHLRDAKRELLVCAQPACPEVVVRECAQWLGELERDLPTVVFGARDADGRDLRDVAVTFDGQPFLTRLDGVAIPVDPGTHELIWEKQGGGRMRSSVVVRTGEKNRLVSIRFEDLAPKPRRSLVGPFVLGGAGVAAFGGFIAFGELASHKVDSLRSTCAPHCASGDVRAARNEALVADVFLGAGIAALAGATIWFIATPSSSAPPRDLAIRF